MTCGNGCGLVAVGRCRGDVPLVPQHEIGPQAERTCLETGSLMRDVQEVTAEVGAKSAAPEHPSGNHLDDSSSLKICFCGGASLSCFAFMKTNQKSEKVKTGMYVE